MKTVNEIRANFLDYFASQGHQKVSSSSLVPVNDASLMFTNAGMVQFKNVFTGLESRNYNRAVTAQKCVRAGGKHNDLDNVGYTARHHTFFEMLGNFSFGDYFKEQAIYYAWDFLTNVVCLPKDKLLVTIYAEDQEAKSLWQKIASLPEEKIIPISTSDNFWSMGDTGPCGPCSEIFYDHGENVPGGPPGSTNEDGDRFVEIWNLVFMQYDQQENNKRVNLPKPSIDTGAGIERLAAVLQHVSDNYEIDLFVNLIRAMEDVIGVKASGKELTSYKIIADHLRSMSFLIADGVLPSNEKRGYVLRRIMRRAMRHAHLLGMKNPVIWEFLPALIAEMGGAYPQLIQSENFIRDTIKAEEEKFGDTLHRGIDILHNELKTMPAEKKFSGDVAFKLYDTYGFPLDLTQDILKSSGLEVDVAVFDKAMEEQKRKARENWTGSGDATIAKIWFDLASSIGPTKFIGYEHHVGESTIKAIISGNELCEVAETGQEYCLLLDQTIFYAESGGQVSDIGYMETDNAKLEVLHVYKLLDGLFIHKVKILEGSFHCHERLNQQINIERRLLIAANHSATHLLHKALREVLGEGVMQKGSLVHEHGLRFDFSYDKPLTDAQLTKIENLVNNAIINDGDVLIQEIPLEEALKQGAMALFSEKYGKKVRLVSMGKDERDDFWSKELCGGTHCKKLADIASFKIIGQRSVAAGVRRIEAITKALALNYVSPQILEQVNNYLPVRMFADIAKELKEADQANNWEQEETFSVQDVTVKLQVLYNKTAQELKNLADRLLKEEPKRALLLYSVNQDSKLSLVVSLSKDLLNKYNAIDMVRLASPILGGNGGGGKPAMAQAGGNDGSKIKIATSALLDYLKST